MSILHAVLGIGYPVLILAALSWLEPWQTALIVLGIAAARLLLLRPAFGASAPSILSSTMSVARGFSLPLVGMAAVLLFTVFRNDPVGLLLAPVLMNLVLLSSFSLSLWTDRPMVERFARLHVHDLPPDEVRYCRSVTKVWCGFFVLNGGICLVLALQRESALWALYTGFVSYLLIGTLFGAEYVYRHWRFRRYRGGFADRALSSLFPPRLEPSANGAADPPHGSSRR
jgi:uncharacterized membrane protein